MKMGTKIRIKRNTLGSMTNNMWAASCHLNEGLVGKIDSHCILPGKIYIDIDGAIWEVNEDDIEPVEEKLNWKDQGLCPHCGRRGKFISLAIVCEEHGIYV